MLVGTAFTVMAGLLAIHGLATPGIWIGPNGVIALTGAGTLPVGGAVLALTALPSLRRPSGVRRLLIGEAVAFVVIVALGLAGMLDPDLVPPVPQANSAPALAALGVGLAFYGLLLLRALKTYLLTRRPADFVVVVGVAWLTAALPPALTMTYLDLGWWLGHVFELLGIVIVGAAVAADLMRTAQSRSLIGDLRAAELVAQEEAFLGARVRSLTLRLAAKDESTEEHTRRVALRAVQVGEELGLPPGRLRSLAIGGLLHDIGKLSVPERILKKPAALTDDEFAVIKRHPEWATASSASSAASATPSAGSSAATTSGWTAAATRTASTRSGWTSTRASSPSATSTTPSSRRASTAAPGASSGRSSTCARRRMRSTRGACVPSRRCCAARRSRSLSQASQRLGQRLPGSQDALVQVAVAAHAVEDDAHR